MHLANAALRKIKRNPNLFHRELFIIVKNDDHPLVAVETFGHESHEIGFLIPASRIFTLLIFENINLANVLVAVGFIPLFVEADHSDSVGVADEFFQLLGA